MDIHHAHHTLPRVSSPHEGRSLGLEEELEECKTGTWRFDEPKKWAVWDLEIAVGYRKLSEQAK